MHVLRANERGLSRTDWLTSRHSFSFAEWFDPDRTRLGALRVLNDDWVAPGAGFGAHPHRDMEIVSYVLEGGLAHRDSSGHAGVIRAGEAQFMRAGRGVVHSEMNASRTEPVHFLQVWFTPRTRGLEPTHDQRALKLADDGSWTDVAGGAGFAMDADAVMRVARLVAGGSARYSIDAGRAGYLFVAEGAAEANGARLEQGDALQTGPTDVIVHAAEGALLVLFDVADV